MPLRQWAIYQSAERTNDNSPAVHCWDKESGGFLVREADDCMIRDPDFLFLFSRPLHGLRHWPVARPSDESLGYCHSSANADSWNTYPTLIVPRREGW